MQPETRIADVIVVLGARALSGGRPSQAMRRRVLHAVVLFEAGAADRLLMSGGRIGGLPAEAEIMRGLAIEAGVPEDRIHLETDSHSTLENAIYSARMLGAQGWSRPLVVSWLPILIAEKFAELAVWNRAVPIIYIIVTFYILPFLIILFLA